jgi:hypothetical protein
VLRQHGNTIFLAFAVAHDDLIVGKIKVFADRKFKALFTPVPFLTLP